MTRAQITALALSAALTGGFIVGCGSDEETASSDKPAVTADASTPQASAESAPDGKQLFGANCSACHTLADAGSSGTSGPNLDELKPNADTVTRQVTNGGGSMPAFGDRLSAEEISAIADYVSGNAGS